MCTVSYFAFGRTCIITSNRDEHVSRPSAHKPHEEILNGNILVYPKDPRAGGTWFAAKDDGTIGVLLNGAFKNFNPNDSYNKSRGLVVLEIVSSLDPSNCLEHINLNTVAPFTFILKRGQLLLEFRWDGLKKYSKKLDPKANYIWSSVTLYDPIAIRKREAIFARFLKCKSLLSKDLILDFHGNNNGDFDNGFVIDRLTGIKTFSITQAILDQEEITFTHLDLLNTGKKTLTIPLPVIIG